MSAKKLMILDTQEVRDGMTTRAFNYDSVNEYLIDEWIMDFLDITEQPASGYRPATIQIVPYSVLDGGIVYWGFNGVEKLTTFVSLQLKPSDFVARHEVNDRMMSFAKTVIGKIFITLDQPNLGMNVSTSDFQYPAIINGEIVWAFEVKADTETDADEMVGNLGSIAGRFKSADVIADTERFDELSKMIASYKDNVNAKP